MHATSWSSPSRTGFFIDHHQLLSRPCPHVLTSASVPWYSGCEQSYPKALCVFVCPRSRGFVSRDASRVCLLTNQKDPSPSCPNKTILMLTNHLTKMETNHSSCAASLKVCLLLLFFKIFRFLCRFTCFKDSTVNHGHWIKEEICLQSECLIFCVFSQTDCSICVPG